MPTDELIHWNCVPDPMLQLFGTMLAKLQVNQSDSESRRRISDGDKPTSPLAATWGIIDFFAVFPWAAFNIATWLSGSMLLALGLTVPEAIGAAVTAHALATILYIAVGHVGTKWRLSDPLSSRLAWGLKGYRVILVVQIAIITCWYSIKMVYGYLCVKVVVGAIIPSFIRMRNSFSENLPTNDFICLIIFLVLSAVFQSLTVNVWRIIGPYGAVLTGIAFIAIVATCCGKAGGLRPLVDQPYTYVGLSAAPPTSQVTWASFLAISSLLATTGILFEGNYTRFARDFKAPIPGQLIGHFAMPLVITVFGILATSAAVEICPNEDHLLWSPTELLLAFQREGSAGARAATFFAGLVLIVPQLGINVVWNSYTTGINYSTLFPRWLTVRRGGLVTLVLAVAINPWNFANKPSGFNRFLNGTSMLYGCLIGIFITDYFIIRKRLVKVSDLLSNSSSSRYWYMNGTNWRAVAAFVAAIWIPFPGWIMVMKNNTDILSNAWQKMYGLAWVLCFIISGLVYYTLSKIWPMEGLYETDPVDTEYNNAEISFEQESQATVGK